MVAPTTFSDFILFLYVHMAMSDGILHPDEEKVILEKMIKLYPGESDLKIRFDEAHQEYLAIDPKSVMPIVRETFKQYNQVKSNQMYKIYMDLFDIVNADGKIDESERIALDALKEIIDTHSAAVRK